MASAGQVPRGRGHRVEQVARRAAEDLGARVVPPLTTAHEVREFLVYNEEHERQGDILGCIACGAYAHGRRLLRGRHPQTKMPYKLWQVELMEGPCQLNELRQGQASHQL
eukprot:1174744-Amphidinium_carterae.1